MTDENFLSQEDIDALMDGMGGDDAGASDTGSADSGSGGDSGGSEDGDSSAGFGAETIKPAFELILRQASTVITTVLNKNTEMTIDNVDTSSAATIWGSAEQFKFDALCVKATYTSGLTGELYYVLSQKDTARLADLMMMGDGTAEYEDDHKDALAELINQVMGAVSTAMGTEYGISISTEQVTVESYDETNLPFDAETSILGNVGVKTEDFEDSEMLLIANKELAESLSSHYAVVEPESDSSQMSMEVSMGGAGEMGDFDSGGGDTNALYKSSGDSNIDMLMDVPLDVSIELGRSNVSIRKVLELGPGSIIELDKKASEPVDLLVNDKLVARGEVVVVDEYFGIRIVSLVSPEERIKHLR